jgi:hypothetical protein
VGAKYCPDYGEVVYNGNPCNFKIIQTIVLSVAFGGGFVILLSIILMFTNCLKRRKEKDGFGWKCRKATRRCECLKKRPRSYEEHLQRQIEKAKKDALRNASYNSQHTLNMTTGNVSQANANGPSYNFNPQPVSTVTVTNLTVPDGGSNTKISHIRNDSA